MKIKLKNIETGDELCFDSEEFHIALQMEELELDQIKSMESCADGKSPLGLDFRSFGMLRAEEGDDLEDLVKWSRS